MGPPKIAGCKCVFNGNYYIHFSYIHSHSCDSCQKGREQAKKTVGFCMILGA
jgi:hypothetical protein